MANGSRIRAGVLGDLAYDDERDHWALEIGQVIAVVALLQCGDDEQERQHHLSDECNKRLLYVNQVLDTYSIPFNFPTDSTENLGQRAHDVAKIIKIFKGTKECALLSIGECISMLRDGLPRADKSVRDTVYANARGALYQIRSLCPELSLNEEALWDLLSCRKPEELSDIEVRTLLRHLGQPLSILLLSADARDQPRLRLGEESRELEEALQLTKFRKGFKVHVQSSCRIRDINSTLYRTEPTILHFSGHGSSRGLCFENDQGHSTDVDPKALAELFREQKSLKLVVLNACYSSLQAQSIADAVGYVISVEGQILDRDAITFSRELYTSLGWGATVEDAFERAKKVVLLGSDGSKINPRLLKGRNEGAMAQKASQEAPSDPRSSEDLNLEAVPRTTTSRVPSTFILSGEIELPDMVSENSWTLPPIILQPFDLCQSSSKYISEGDDKSNETLEGSQSHDDYDQSPENLGNETEKNYRSSAAPGDGINLGLQCRDGALPKLSSPAYYNSSTGIRVLDMPYSNRCDICFQIVRKESRIYDNHRAAFYLIKVDFFTPINERFDEGRVDIVVDPDRNMAGATKVKLARPKPQEIPESAITDSRNFSIKAMLSTPDFVPVSLQLGTTWQYNNQAQYKGSIKIQALSSETWSAWYMTEDSRSKQGIPSSMTLAVVLEVDPNQAFTLVIAGQGHVRTKWFKWDYRATHVEVIHEHPSNLQPAPLCDLEVNEVAGIDTEGGVGR